MMDTKILSTLKGKITTLCNLVDSLTTNQLNDDLKKKISECLTNYQTVLLTILEADEEIVFDPDDIYAQRIATLKAALGGGHVSRPIEKLLTPAPFNGSLLGFPSWRSTTLKLLRETKIPSDQKLLALKNSLSGSALKLVENADSWELALNRLEARFTNKKVLLEYCVKTVKFFKSDWKSLNNASEFVNLVEDVINLLYSVKVSVDDEKSLMKEILRKLPVTFRNDFIKSKGQSTDLKKLSKFIKDNVDGIVESAEYEERPEKIVNPNKKVKRCLLCKGDHHTFRCNSGSPSSRRALVTKQNACLICIGKHATKTCKSKFRCKKCKEAHATMLCEMNVVEDLIEEELLN